MRQLTKNEIDAVSGGANTTADILSKIREGIYILKAIDAVKAAQRAAGRRIPDSGPIQ